MRLILCLLAFLAAQPVTGGELFIREIRYNGTLTETEARFTVDLDLEATGPAAAPLFEGDVAVLNAKLPAPLRLTRTGCAYHLAAARAGRHKFQLDLVAKITRAEPWNQITFTGPVAVIAAIAAQAPGEGLELQLLQGTTAETGTKAGVTRLRGFLGADRVVSLRWQSKAAEVVRTALLTCATTARVQVTPTVVKYTTQLQYEIVQGTVPRLALRLPANQALIRLQGDSIRDWQVADQRLTVEFIKPVEKSVTLTLFTEQAVEGAALPVEPPQPLAVEREAGTVQLTAEDVQVETENPTGLRQINAAPGDLAAWQFYARPFGLTVKLRRIEPVVSVADRVGVRLEEARLLVTHALTLTVEKAGIYALELVPPPGMVVADVRGEGVEDWKAAAGTVAVTFSKRILGTQKLEVQLEQALKTLPEKFAVESLRVTGAVRSTAQIGAAAVAGIQLKTAGDELVGVREIPINRLAQRTDEGLAYLAQQPDWKLALAAERLAARVTADIFNLVTIGDGLVGGSATLRYAIINQGVQEFRVKLPAQWKNIEFTGPNIRRKELQDDTWVIGLQEKAWGGYTLVVTYDMPFDPHTATLPVGGAHAVGVERETGSIAITSAANLQIRGNPGPALRRVDSAELTDADRALITRPVLLAYRYAGPADAAELAVDVRRFEELPVLEAVADRTQLTTVLTDAGQLLTQASFMVKNNEKQYQTFTLPAGADFWACYVRGEPVKPERSGAQLLVPLPRGVNRDEAFAVDIVYAQTIGALSRWWPRSVALAAPRTDVQTTYAEWELFVPATQRLAAFGGNMTVARGTTYGLRDAWREFIRFYDGVFQHGFGLAVAAGVVLLVGFFIASAIRRGWRGVIPVFAVLAIVFVLAAMLLPALSSSRAKARQVATVSNLRQVGLAIAQFADEHQGNTPGSLEELMPKYLTSPRVLHDVGTGERFTYVGAGLKWQDNTDAILAYSADNRGGGTVLYNDGRVEYRRSLQFGAGGSGVRTETSLTPEPAAPPAVTGPPAGGPDKVEGKPMAAGIRPIRIEIPKTGARLVFTKVLNVRSEPLTVSALAMPQRVFNTVRGLTQAAVFVVGLVLFWWHVRPAGRRSSFALTVALALMIGGVTAMLVSYRLLDEALIVAAPLVGLVVAVWAIQKLWRRMAPPAPVAPPVIAALLLACCLSANAAEPAASIVSAQYTGAVRALDEKETARVAQFDAVLTVDAAEANQSIRLFGPDVAVQEFSGPTGGWWRERSGARLVWDQGGVSVVLPQKGPATLRLKFLVKLTGDVTKRRLQFALPAALSSRAAVTLDEPDATVEVPSAVSFQTVPDGPKTRVEAVLGAADRLELHWTPRTKRAAEIAATVFCQNASRVSFGGGVVSVRSVLDYTVTQGELRQARVRLPAGQRLMRVGGEAIRTWKLDGDVVTVELVKGVTPSYRLTVETEKPLALAAQDVAVPRALDVQRETGLVALQAGDELAVSVESASELQKVDVEEFAPAAAGSGVASAYRFLKPEFALVVRVAPVLPQVEAVLRQLVRIGTEQIGLSAAVDYTIKRAGVFALRLAVPPGYRVERVTGPNLAQWVEREGTLEVTLPQRTTGAYSLQVELVKNLRELPATLTVTGVQPLEVQKLTGSVSVAAEEGVQVKTETFTGVSEMPAPAGLAFKLIPGAAPGWQVTVSTEKIESWVRAEVVNWVTLTETLVSGRSVVRYEIANAPTKELRVQVPAAFRNVEVTGPNIRRKDPVAGEWRIELQNKVRGAYLLTVTWEQPWDAAAGKLELPGVQAGGVERETGFVAVTARPPLRVEGRSVADLLKVDGRELPDWAGRGEPTLAYRYLRPGFVLALGAQRFEEAEVLQALVDNVRLTTVVSEDGQMMTEMALAVRNNARQYLEVTLPAGASNVWSAFVAGQPVRPMVRDGKLLVPMERSGADGAPVSVELTYVGASRFPRHSGKVELQTPALDMPLKNARWDLYLPPDFEYTALAGSMRQELAAEVRRAAAAPVAQVFGWSEYAREESKKKVARDAETQSSLSNARAQLRGGKVTDAWNFYSRAKGNVGTDDYRANEDLKRLEKELRQEQGKQMQQAQQGFVAMNAAVPQVDYDLAAAEKQAEKVQKAQEIAVAKALPLRVNLPKRGVHLAFTQVLQTELRKPLTVEFAAAEAKAISWPAALGLGALGLAGLWVLVAVGLRRG